MNPPVFTYRPGITISQMDKIKGRNQPPAPMSKSDIIAEELIQGAIDGAKAVLWPLGKTMVWGAMLVIAGIACIGLFASMLSVFSSVVACAGPSGFLVLSAVCFFGSQRQK